jgi:Astacin (Peptidase family M12A)/Chitobiase/beta-hexosaminidase C-terminal domain/Divergent InlB B-repeat domain
MAMSRQQVLALLGLFLIGFNVQSQPPRSRPTPPAAWAPVHGAQPDSLAVAYSQGLWPKVNGVATVFYAIDAASDPNALSKIQAAIGTFNADFPGLLQWVPWTSSVGPNYVDIDLNAADTSGVCEADEGYEAIPMQPMTGSTNCTIGTILHEMGHVIGLLHEQSRADRDTYITVNYNNVIKGSWSNFQVLTDNQQLLASYDYASVMQYIPYAFTRNGGVVIESIPAGIPMAGYEGVPAQAGPPGAPAQPGFDYSAGDKETIQRLYGAAPTQVTITSNPLGLSVIVDGAAITTPQSYAWPLYSTHTLDVAAEVQTLPGAILNSNPPVAATFYYNYGRWSDGAPQSHTITVTPGNGSGTFPSTAPQIATYSANFIEIVPYTAAVYPPKSAQVTVAPQPQRYAGASGKFFVAREQATLTATGIAGWNFYEFNNAPFWLPGGLGANPKTFYVPDSGNPVDTTAEFSNMPVYTVDIQPETFSSNAYVYVDSQFAYTPKNFSGYYDSSWTPGSAHTVALDAAEYPYSSNSRYNFSSWSDGGQLSHSIASLPGTATSYVATVTPEFQPATNFDYPPCGGSAALSPASPTNDGFYPSRQQLSFSATPDAGWSFAGWTYDLSGTANPAVLQATDETLVFANFNTVDVPLTLSGVSPSSAIAGGSAFTLTLNGSGFTPASLVSANDEYRAVTFVSSQVLTVPLTAADIAASGAFQVYVENYPSGWSGCAVFGYQTFLVTGAGPPAATPTFSPASGDYTTAQTVSISDATARATIHYTTNGKTPTTASSKYAGPITVSSSETIKAIAVKTGYTQSPVASATYTFPAATPVFSPTAGNYGTAQSVSISDATTEATIHYTTNGRTPTTASTKYTGPITVSSTETLKAIAVKTGYTQSSVASATYTIEAPH